MRKYLLIFASACILLLHMPAHSETYPQFDVSGYKKWKFYQTKVTPMSNFFLAQTHLGAVTSSYAGPWEERLSLKIDSRLNEHLLVTYDIEQEPETPQRSDVKVKYDNTELFFGEFTASFSENEFVSANKYVNGVMLTSFDKNYTFKLVPSAKVKSNNQSLATAYGNNTRGPYSLGRGMIVEDSEKIYLNDIFQKRGIDYTLDYFDGKITFTRILSPADRYTYSYEYTNIADLFFPTISKRDFFGIQGSTTFSKWFFEKDRLPESVPVSFESKQAFPTINKVYPPKPAATAEAGTPEAGTPADTVSVEVRPFATEESAGLFRLKHKPVVEFSEVVAFQGNTLQKYEDYSINYTDGTVMLMPDYRPSAEEPLSITYSYYRVTAETVAVPGIDSKGPYFLPHRKVVKNSENITVDGKKNLRGLDYDMDYDNGGLVFYLKISPSSTIIAGYTFIETVMVGTPETGNAFTIGGTYLKESAKKGSATAATTIVESRKGSELSGNLLNLKHYPVDPSQTVTVKVNGSDYTDFYVPTGDAQSLPLPYITDAFDQSDGYATGTLKFNSTLGSTDEITVIYTYKKSIYGKYTGAGNGSKGPYYLTNVSSVIPGSDTSIIVRTDGSSVIETFTKNSSRDTFDGKFKINYNYPYIPYITFNDDFLPTKKFDITYYYVPTSLTQDENINHDVTGVTTSIKIGEKGRIDAALGISRTDQAIIQESAQDTISGNNTRGPYSLTHQSLIDGSEKVQVNGFQKNKDIDYFINYSSGQITFYYLTLASTDQITVQYNYQSTGGISAGTTMRTGNAYRVTTAFETGGVSMTGVYKEIDPNFSPFESTNIGSGSQQKGMTFAYSPNSFITTSGGLLETKNQIGGNVGKFVWNTDRNIGVGMNPGGLANISLNYRNYKSFDDLIPGATAHSTDNFSNQFSGSFAPKTIEYKLITFDNSNDFSKQETVNNLDDSSTRVSFFHTYNKMNIAKKANFGLNYQFSEPRSDTSEGNTSHQVSKDLTYDFDWDLTFWKIKRLTTRAKIITHDQTDLKNNTGNSTKNQSINFAFDPLDNLSTTYDKSRQENLSVQVGKDNPMTENSQYTVRFTPFSMLSLNYTGADDQSLQESGAQNFGLRSSTQLAFTPFSFLRINSSWDHQDRTTTSLNGTMTATSNLLTNSRVYGASTSFSPLGLVNLNADVNVEDYDNKNDIGTVFTMTQNVTQRYGAAVSPLPILSSSGTFTKKITKDLVLNQERPKENWDATATLKVFDWGNLIYNWSQERNFGEVQAGIVTNYDILKITNTYSFSSTIPQSSVILSSIVLSANYKIVDYFDFLVPTNNFSGNTLSFEGTLNF